MAHRLVRGLRGLVKPLLLQQQSQPLNSIFRNSTRNYVAEMRKSAFEGNIARLIRNEIQYELDHPPSEYVPEFNAFKVDERRGEHWIQLSRKFGENEEIKVEATMFDGVDGAGKEDDETSGDRTNHITLIIDIFKGKDNAIVEFVCSAWPDSIEIRKVFTRGHIQAEDNHYTGPPFMELDDELQKSLYDFLEERGIDDELAEFLHHCMKNKEKTEYLNWLEKLKSVIQKN